MSIKILSGRSPHKTVPCVIFELGMDDRGSPVEIARRDCSDGMYQIRYPGRAKLIKVVPLDGHWSCIKVLAGADPAIYCVPIDDNLELPWWQRVVGVKSLTDARANEKLKIGVIDMIFAPSEHMNHLCFVDTAARRNVVFKRLTDVSATHGQRVSSVLGARGPGQFRGIAEGAQFFFADATFFSSDGRCYEGVPGYPEVAEAIEKLSSTHKVDLINLSLGFDQIIPDMVDTIEEAADGGTLCICAGGNSSGQLPDFPACLDSVIGVGGIGFEGIAPKGTSLEQSAQLSIRRGGRGREFPGFGHVFHDIDTCIGDGIDVCGPSIGIVLKQRNGIVVEYRGTSYAAPIVTGVLACKLANDDQYRDLRGRKRHTYARQQLMELCCDLGLDRQKVGRGLPQL